MAGGTYLVGWVAVVAVVAALVHGSGAVRRALLPGWTGARGVLAQTVVALAIGLTVARLAGAVGLLTGPVVLGAEVGAGLLVGLGARRWARTRGAATPGPRAAADRPAVPVGAAAARRGSHPHRDGGTEGVRPSPNPDAAAGGDGPPVPPRSIIEWVLAIVPLSIVLLQWLAHTGDAIGRGMVHPDTLWYHGPFAARFAQTGSVGRLDGVGYEAARWFPLDGQLVHALGFLAFDRDWLSPLVNLGWMALALLAAWCIGERRRAGPAALSLAAVVLGLPLLAATQPGQMSTDIACSALLLAALALVFEADLRPVPLSIAGMAAGLALGSKVTFVVPLAVLVVGVAALAYARRGFRPALAWIGGCVALGSFWFARSWVLTGSPLPWFTVPGLFDRVTVEGQGASLLVDHDLGRETWDTIYRPGFHQALGPAWPLVLGLVALGATLLARRGRPAVERIAGLLVLAGVAGHIATPLTGGVSFAFNLRYLSPTLLVAATLVPLAVRSGRGARIAVGAAATALVVAGATADHVERIPAWPDATPEAAGVLVGIVVVVAGAVALSRRVAPGAVVAGLVLVAVVAGWPVQVAHDEGRYVSAGLPPTDAIPVALRDVSHQRVVIYGSVETFPLFGLDLSNDVEVGTNPTASGSACASWRTHIGGDHDIVVVSRWGFMPLAIPPPEVFDDPAAQLVVRDGAHAVYRLDGPLDPTTCPV